MEVYFASWIFQPASSFKYHSTQGKILKHCDKVDKINNQNDQAKPGKHGIYKACRNVF